jgi:Gas vesicle synthesis protein GvpO.
VSSQGPTETDSQSDDPGNRRRNPETGEEMDILRLREHISEVSETLLDYPFDGVTSVERADDGGWHAVFEVVERNAVPDTQDIIGRYELHLSATGDVVEYSLQQRFKRSELQGETL